MSSILYNKRCELDFELNNINLNKLNKCIKKISKDIKIIKLVKKKIF